MSFLCRLGLLIQYLKVKIMSKTLFLKCFKFWRLEFTKKEKFRIFPQSPFKSPRLNHPCAILVSHRYISKLYENLRLKEAESFACYVLWHNSCRSELQNVKPKGRTTKNLIYLDVKQIIALRSILFSPSKFRNPDKTQILFFFCPHRRMGVSKASKPLYSPLSLVFTRRLLKNKSTLSWQISTRPYW